MPYAAFDPNAVVVTRPSLDDLRALAARKAPSITIFEYPFDSLTPLAVLHGTNVLKMQDSGALRTLSGVESLDTLLNLVISTPPSWDGSNRRIEVDSLAPLARLPRLERLILIGVRPRDLDVRPIAGMKQLREVDIGGVPEFGVEEYGRLAAALPHAEGRCLRPYNQLQGIGFCGKCKGKTVLLTGAPPRARKWLCPVCNEKKLAEHVRAWEAAKSRATT